MRPPSVTLFLFAAAAAFLVWGAIAVRQPAAIATDSNPGTTTLAADAASSLPAAPDLFWRFNALDPGLDEKAATATLFDPSDDYWGLPREHGFDLVAAYCTSCHSLRIVMQQSASEPRWRELMLWMVEKQGMAEPPEEDLDAIIRYLSVQFGA